MFLFDMSVCPTALTLFLASCCLALSCDARITPSLKTAICSKIAVKVRANEDNECLHSNCRVQPELDEIKSIRHN